MKIIKRTIFFLSLLIALSFSANSQILVKDFLNSNLADAEKLSKAYLEPFGKSFGTSLNNGWYNSAKPHKLFGFDLTFTAAITVPPSGDKTFNVNKLGLEDWTLKTGEPEESPTVTGPKESGPTIVNTTNSQELELPQGANLKFIPAPIIQVGVGLPFNTEIVGRFFPKVDIQDIGKFSLWGVGVKNEFKEFIPWFKHLPLNVSAFIGYTKFQSTFDINSSKKQELVFEAAGFTGKLLISKSIPILTIYAGVGYNKSKTDVTLKGDYTISGITDPVTDPISLDFTNSGINANIGIRVKVAVIAFHFDYAVGKFSVYNAGVGINFR